MIVKGTDGKPVQVPQAVVAQAQLGLVQPGPDGMVSLPGPDGKPVKIPQAALASAAPTVLAGTNHQETHQSSHTFQIDNMLLNILVFNRTSSLISLPMKHFNNTF